MQFTATVRLICAPLDFGFPSLLDQLANINTFLGKGRRTVATHTHQLPVEEKEFSFVFRKQWNDGLQLGGHVWNGSSKRTSLGEFPVLLFFI